MCDIFECPEMSDRSLRFQVYTERSTGNYEGRSITRDSHRYRNGKKTSESTLRYSMV